MIWYPASSRMKTANSSRYCCSAAEGFHSTRLDPGGRQVVRVHADQLVGVRVPHPAGDEAAPITSLDAQPPNPRTSVISLAVVSAISSTPKGLARRKTIRTREGRGHDGEGIRRIAPETAGVGQASGISMNSKTEPGQPCSRSSGFGFGQRHRLSKSADRSHRSAL